MILNQNEINTIQNISSLEALKDYILNSVNTEFNYTSNNISVRVLSKEEYDKYITTGTCGGAITTNDMNVWHKPFPTPQNNVHVAAFTWDYTLDKATVIQHIKIGNGNFKLYQPLNNMINSIEPEFRDYNNWEYYLNKYARNGDSYTYTINMNSELLSTNISNQNNLANQQNIKNYIVCITKDNSDYGMVYTSYTLPTIFTASKINTTTTTPTTTAATNRVGYNNSYNYTYLKCVLTHCFRPVFQYKDNNKSNNIYY